MEIPAGDGARLKLLEIWAFAIESGRVAQSARYETFSLGVV